MNTEPRQRYFLAIIPPEPIHDYTLDQKSYIKDRYNSKAALRSPPHITLHMPFELRASKKEMLGQMLEQFTKDQKNFNMSLKGYGCFEPRVIFINVENSKRLQNLHISLSELLKKEFNIFNASHKGRAYHPHLTVAFRDLKKNAFYEAWEEFKDKRYEQSFEVNSISLMKHNGSIWEVYNSFPFGE